MKSFVYFEIYYTFVSWKQISKPKFPRTKYLNKINTQIHLQIYANQNPIFFFE